MEAASRSASDAIALPRKARVWLVEFAAPQQSGHCQSIRHGGNALRSNKRSCIRPVVPMACGQGCQTVAFAKRLHETGSRLMTSVSRRPYGAPV
jgi:hypothetical protein